MKRSCVCENWKAGFLPRLLFNWCTFSIRVTARWSPGWAKNKCRLIRTREIGGVRFQEEIYADLNLLDVYISSVNVLFVSKTSSRHNLKTSLRCLCNASSICLEDVSEDEKLLR